MLAHSYSLIYWIIYCIMDSIIRTYKAFNKTDIRGWAAQNWFGLNAQSSLSLGCLWLSWSTRATHQLCFLGFWLREGRHTCRSTRTHLPLTVEWAPIAKPFCIPVYIRRCIRTFANVQLKTNRSYPGPQRGFSSVLRDDSEVVLWPPNPCTCVCFWMATSICVHTERASNHCQFLDNRIDRWSKMATIFIAVFCFGYSVGVKIKNRQEIWEAQQHYPSWQEEFLASFEKSRVQARHSRHRGKRQPPTCLLNPIFDPIVPEWWSPLPLWPHTLPRWASHLPYPSTSHLATRASHLASESLLVCSSPTSHPRACCRELCKVDQPQEGLTSGFSKPCSETSWRAWTLIISKPAMSLPFLLFY